MNQSILDVIKRRFSCRIHTDKLIDEDIQLRIKKLLETHNVGPFGNQMRFALIAATEDDHQALKNLGTYGFIKGAKGFIVGALGTSPKNLEDFGYIMEYAILFATDLGLGTCWLGGSFTKNNFAKKINATENETIPAVTSIGYIAEHSKAKDWIRRRAGGAARLLYLQRTKGYGKDSLLGKMLGVADLQRVDMGIAMCHFELTAHELGLNGRWVLTEPDIEKLEKNTEYTVSWITDLHE